MSSTFSSVLSLRNPDTVQRNRPFRFIRISRQTTPNAGLQLDQPVDYRPARYLKTILLILLIGAWSPFLRGQPDFAARREAMVRTQIVARGIRQPEVLAALRKVERHRFVPAEYVSEAYNDHPLPIGYNQTISQPYIVALMTEQLQLKSSDRVLEIGTGSGYQAAVLAAICDSVFSIEIVSPLAHQAAARLRNLGYHQVLVKDGDGYRGWPEHAPFDAIIVTCSPSAVPPALSEQLAEGGRMIIPVGKAYYEELVLLEKRQGKIRQRAIIPVRFVPMVDSDGRRY